MKTEDNQNNRLIGAKIKMDEKGLKESFAKIKEDMLFLSQQLISMREEIDEIKELFLKSEKDGKTADNQQIQHISSNDSQIYAGIKPYFKDSKGNEGVPADSQQTSSRSSIELKRTFDQIQQMTEKPGMFKKATPVEITENTADKIQNTEEELSKLSRFVQNMKQELKDKFKNLSKQEFLIFSALYSLEEQSKEITYKDLAISMNLTESSIRDYISRLIHKGIPIIKERLNNKTVLLKISPELRSITTLDLLTKINSRQI